MPFLMKKLFLIVVLAVGCLASTSAQVTFSNSPVYGSISGTPTSLATNAGAWVFVGYATLPSPPVYALSHGALSVTNDVTNIVQFAYGNTNYPVNATNLNPSSATAGAADSFSMPRQSIPVYSRVLVVATNSVSGGATLTFGTSALH